eukprot:15438939-Alexandrium_andersonii.AAC.1
MADSLRRRIPRCRRLANAGLFGPALIFGLATNPALHAPSVVVPRPARLAVPQHAHACLWSCGLLLFRTVP